MRMSTSRLILLYDHRDCDDKNIAGVYLFRGMLLLALKALTTFLFTPLAVAQLDFIFFLELLIDLLRPIRSFLDCLMGKRTHSGKSRLYPEQFWHS